MKRRKLSYSSLSCWNRCRQKYKWKYIDNYMTPSSPGQIRGSVGHAALGEWYRTTSEDAALQAASNKLAEYEEKSGEQMQDDWNLMSLVLKRYFEYSRSNDYFSLLDKETGIERRFDIELGGNILTGFIDAVVSDGRMNWILEHKFMKQASVKHVDIDMQISVYMLAAERLGYKVTGVLYNVVRVGEGGICEREPVLRVPVFRNHEALAYLESELSRQIKEVTRFNEEQHLPVYRSATKDCSWDCSFYPACLSLNSSGEAESVLNGFEIYEPEEDEQDE